MNVIKINLTIESRKYLSPEVRYKTSGNIKRIRTESSTGTCYPTLWGFAQFSNGFDQIDSYANTVWATSCRPTARMNCRGCGFHTRGIYRYRFGNSEISGTAQQTARVVCELASLIGWWHTKKFKQ